MKRPRVKDLNKVRTQHFIHDEQEKCVKCRELCFKTMGGKYVCYKCGKVQDPNNLTKVAP